MSETSQKFHTFSVESPEQFSFKAEHWDDWIARFERFRSVSELSEKAEDYQVNVLLYMLGPKSEELIKSLNLSKADLKSYKSVKEKISHFYEPKHNVIFCRAKFNARYQNQGEPIEAYISSLHQLADKCKYGTIEQELIRDRLVVGIRNKKLSEKMQLTEGLTLEKAIDMAVQQELVHKQQKDMQANGFNGSKPPSLSHIDGKKGKWKGKKGGGQKGSQKDNPDHEKLKSPCPKCNNSVHFVKGVCPADGKTCHRCNGKNHFPIKPNFPMCRTVNKSEEIFRIFGNCEKY